MMPELISVLPVKVFAPVKTSVPVPLMVRLMLFWLLPKPPIIPPKVSVPDGVNVRLEECVAPLPVPPTTESVSVPLLPLNEYKPARVWL